MRIITEYIHNRHLAEVAKPHSVPLRADLLIYVKPGINKHELAEAHKLNFFDIALPVDWVKHFQHITGINPVSEFVWCYDTVQSGEPYPLTIGAKVALRIYTRMEK